MLEISESINVWVFFRRDIIQPYCFFWGERKIKIDKVNLVHTSKEGDTLFYYFSVSSEGNFYRLKFDSNKLKWFLEGVDNEDNPTY